MTNNDFNTVLDNCLDRISGGDSIKNCLADYPEFAAELRPLLEAGKEVKQASFSPSDDVRRAARQRLMDAIAKRQKPSFWKSFSRFPGWAAAAATVMLLVVVGLIGLNVIAPQIGGPPTIVVSTPTSEGNFRFLVSDAPNDIGDFSSLTVTVDHIGLQQKNGDGAWIVFTPEVKDFDLTKLIGDASQELWQGNVPEGEYGKIEVYVAAISGTLTDGSTAEVKLPSNKLQIGMTFTVSANSITSFTFDITVNRTGNGAGKYILNPQAGDSGASYQSK